MRLSCSYHIAQNFAGLKFGELIVLSFGEENVGEFTIANISYFSEPGMWLGKILANGICFTKFAKVFRRQNFLLYGIKQSYTHIIKMLWSHSPIYSPTF